MIFFESEEESDLFQKESSYETLVLENAIEDLCNEYLIVVLEDGNSDTGKLKKEGIGSKIAAKIRKLFERIKRFLQGIPQLLKGGAKEKKRVTEEKYMSSEGAAEKFQGDLDAMRKQVDAEYLAAKPLISAISKISSMDPAKVEALADKLNATMANNYENIKKEAKYIAKDIKDQHFRTKGKAFGSDLALKSKKVQNAMEGAQANYEAYIERHPDDVEKVRAMGKATSALGKFASRLYKTANDISVYV